MKKSLLLGSAAALFAIAGAQAADLPVVEPVDYVKVCDAFGAGFHYIPGTETCLKFSGRVRVERGISGGDAHDDDDKLDTSFLNSNFELVVNASSMTEVGLLIGQFAISGSNEGTVTVGDAWITIGENILVGRETSRFDFGGGYGIYDGLYVDEGINQFTFIMPFGNGVSLTLGLEDQRDRRAEIQNRVIVNNASIDAGGFIDVPGTGLIHNWSSGRTSNYGGMEIPEIVASLRISQGWGSAQISAALHQISAMGVVTPPAITDFGATDNTIAASTTELDDGFGFAVQAGVELNVGSTSKVKLVGGYADGALAYIGGKGTTFADAYFDYAFDNTGAFVSSSFDTNSGWYILGAAQHGFGGGITGSLTGSYHDFDEQAEFWQLGATVEYEVVENLLVSIAGVYTSTEYDAGFKDGYLADNVTFDNNGSPTFVEGAETDADAWEAKLRVQRNF